jgi:hypothetical protein
MEEGIWGDGLYALSSSEKPSIRFAPRRGPEFQLVIFKLINSQSIIIKQKNINLIPSIKYASSY